MGKKLRHTRYQWLEGDIISALIRPRLLNIISQGTYSSYKEIAEAFSVAYPEATVNPTLVKEWIDHLGFKIEKQVVIHGLPSPDIHGPMPADPSLSKPLTMEDDDSFDNETHADHRGKNVGGFAAAISHVKKP
jgi:hypothetical protein